MGLVRKKKMRCVARFAGSGRGRPTLFKLPYFVIGIGREVTLATFPSSNQDKIQKTHSSF